MAIMSCVIRKVSSHTVVSAAVLRAIASPRTLCESHVTNALCSKDSGAFASLHRFSTTDTKSNKLVDPQLVKVLKSELKSAKQLALKKIMPEVPADFPFTIEEESSGDGIILKRELPGEKIEIEVDVETPRWLIPKDENEEQETTNTDSSTDDDDDSDDDNATDKSSTNSYCHEKSKSGDDPAPRIMIDVSIHKQNGRLLNFLAYLYADDIKVTTLHIEEEPTTDPESENTYENYWCGVEWESDCLQRALGEFLRIRGINETYFGFLYKYMICKSKRDDMLVLKQLKKNVEE